jgi:hypothetical protein
MAYSFVICKGIAIVISMAMRHKNKSTIETLKNEQEERIILINGSLSILLIRKAFQRNDRAGKSD